MLQINTGKHFRSDVVRVNRLRGVLFGNVRMEDGARVETEAGTLLSADGASRPRPLVYEVDERLEGPVRSGAIASHTVTPFLADFATVASFTLRATLSADAATVTRMTATRPNPMLPAPPSAYVRGWFEETVRIDGSDGDRLARVVRDLLGLDRATFRAAMQAIRTFMSGLERLADDIGAAYTLMVSSIESLAQGFDGHVATWDQYDQAKRASVDAALEGADPEMAGRVRDAILAHEHQAATRRFREFAASHVEAGYFRDHPHPEDDPAGRAELRDLLDAAYHLRSRHLHELKPLPTEISHPHAHREWVLVKGRAHPTFQGLSRLAREVILHFIATSQRVEREPLDYTLEQWGVVGARWSAEYWIGSADGLEPKHGRERLEALLWQASQALRGVEGAGISDVRPAIARAEELLPGMPPTDRRRFVAFSFLYNLLVPPERRSPGFEAFHGEHHADLLGPSGEALALHAVLGGTPAFDLPTHVEAHDGYHRRRNRPNGLRAPRVVESAMSIALAERCRAEGDAGQARAMLAFATENSPGDAVVPGLERGFDPGRPIVWRPALFPLTAGATDDAASDAAEPAAPTGPEP